MDTVTPTDAPPGPPPQQWHGEAAAPVRADASSPAQPQPVVVVDLNMRFGSLVAFWVKAALAAIPALLILLAIGAGAVAWLRLLF